MRMDDYAVDVLTFDRPLSTKRGDQGRRFSLYDGFGHQEVLGHSGFKGLKVVRGSIISKKEKESPEGEES